MYLLGYQIFALVLLTIILTLTIEYMIQDRIDPNDMTWFVWFRRHWRIWSALHQTRKVKSNPHQPKE